MGTQRFWAETFERAVKTAAQVAITGMALYATADAAGTFSSVDWPMVGDMVLYATVLSFITSISSAAFNDPDTPSLVKK